MKGAENTSTSKINPTDMAEYAQSVEKNQARTLSGKAIKLMDDSEIVYTSVTNMSICFF